MKLEVFPDRTQADQAAADWLAACLTRAGVRTMLAAAGNTPLALYRLVGERSLSLAHLQVFALDEYAGVPEGEPRTCGNLLRRAVAAAWRVPAAQFHGLSPAAGDARAGIREHERRIDAAGGIDVAVLGLGQNGHLGFNEPGSEPHSTGRLVDLEPTSVEANRRWFGGDHAPGQGITLGMKTILEARSILLLAYGKEKAPAVAAMAEGPPGPGCPASWLQGHDGTTVFLDREAAGRLKGRTARPSAG